MADANNLGFLKYIVATGVIGAAVLYTSDSELPSKREPKSTAPIVKLEEKAVATPQQMPIKIPELNSENIEDALKGNAIINIWANWCGDYQIQLDGFAKVAEQYKDRGVYFAKVEYDSNEKKLRELGWSGKLNGAVQALACTILIKNGKEVERLTNATKEKLEEKIEKTYADMDVF